MNAEGQVIAHEGRRAKGNQHKRYDVELGSINGTYLQTRVESENHSVERQGVSPTVDVGGNGAISL